jgi:hypothetical protein
MQRAARATLQEMLEALTLIARTEAGLISIERRRPCRLADGAEPPLAAAGQIDHADPIRYNVRVGEVLKRDGPLPEQVVAALRLMIACEHEGRVAI